MMMTQAVEEARGLRQLPRRAYAILSESGEILAYALGTGRRCLGRTQRPILKALLHGALTLADLARNLGKSRQTVHASLQRLEEEGLVISAGAPGRTLHGSRVLRRIYTLNPETCMVAHPVPSLTPDRLREEAQAAQLRGLLRQQYWEAREKMGAHDPVKRSQGARLMRQIRDWAQAALDGEDPHHT